MSSILDKLILRLLKQLKAGGVNLGTINKEICLNHRVGAVT